MSDFLANLVIRHLGATPVIQPRLPSLFEPATPYMGSFAETSRGAEEGRQDAHFEPALESVHGTSTVPPHSQAPANKSRTKGIVNPELPLPVALPLPASDPNNGQVTRSPASVPRPATGGVLREAVASARPANPASAHASTDPKSTQPADPSSEPSGKDRGRKHVEVSRTMETKIPPASVIEPPVLLKSVATGLGKSANQHPGAGSEVPEGAANDFARVTRHAPLHIDETAEPPVKSPLAEPAQSQTERLVPRAADAIEAAATPRFEFARHVPPTPLAAPPEPTIQVTIGRIEVRAVSPQAAAQKERSASPVMSLSEYLRSRRGGV